MPDRLPCGDCGRAIAVRPVEPGGDKPLHDLAHATTDPAVIRRRREAEPAANVGPVVGYAFDVLAVDLPRQVTAYACMRESDDVPDVHGHTSTSGGIHLYVERGTAVAEEIPVNVFGAGYHITAPPSVVDGHRSHWVTLPSPAIKRVGR